MRRFQARLALSYRVPDLVGEYQPDEHPVDIVITGFPRSANTFSVAAFKSLNQGIGIAHHEHSVREMRFGVSRGLPVIALLRSPLDAIASLLDFDRNITVGQALSYYTHYYRAALDCRTKLVIAAFETVTSDPNQIIDAVNAKYRTAFNRFQTAAQHDHVHERMRTVASHFDTPPHRQPFPDAAREQSRDPAHRATVAGHRRFRQAQRIHDALRQHSR